MLVHRLRRWPNIGSTLGWCIVFAGRFTASSPRINIQKGYIENSSFCKRIYFRFWIRTYNQSNPPCMKWMKRMKWMKWIKWMEWMKSGSPETFYLHYCYCANCMGLWSMDDELRLWDICVCKTKRQYLLTYGVSRYCLIALHGSIVGHSL